MGLVGLVESDWSRTVELEARVGSTVGVQFGDIQPIKVINNYEPLLPSIIKDH